jgi:Spy/CpxP family protein refolding chaperone
MAVRKETEPILDSLEVTRKKLMDELSGDEPDRDKLDSLAEEIGSLQAELQKKMIGHLLEGKSLLTPEQQKKFFSLFRGGPDRMHPMGEHKRRLGR